MSRRRRLIEQNENARSGYPPATQTFSTRGLSDPVNAVAYSTPLRGVQNPQGTPYRGTGGAHVGGPIGAPNTFANSSGGAYNAYDPASGRSYDATNANGAYNAVTNANGPIDEAGGAFSKFNAATMSVYSTYARPSQGNDAHQRRRR